MAALAPTFVFRDKSREVRRFTVEREKSREITSRRHRLLPRRPAC